MDNNVDANNIDIDTIDINIDISNNDMNDIDIDNKSINLSNFKISIVDENFICSKVDRNNMLTSPYFACTHVFDPTNRIHYWNFTNMLKKIDIIIFSIDQNFD